MKRFAQWSLQIGLTLVVTWFILDRVGVDLSSLRDLDGAAWRPEIIPFAMSCVVLVGGYILSAALWGRIVRDLGGPALPLLTSVRLFMIANLGRYIPGKIWQIAGLAYLAKREGVPASVATGAAVLGQGIALLAATLIGLGAILGRTELWQWLGWPGSAAGLGLAVVIVAVVSIPRIFHRIVAGWFRLARSELPQGMSRRRNFGLRWLMLYVLNWGIYCVAFWLLYLSFAEWRTFMQVGPAFAAAYVLGYLALFAPAGAGIREGFLVVLLQPVMVQEMGVVFAVIARLWTTTFELIPALILTVWRRPAGAVKG